MPQSVPTNILLIYTMTGQLLTPTGPNVWESVYWKSQNTPDFLGALSGYQGNLQNIRIASVEQISSSLQFVIPTSPAGGDLTGFYPNPTIFAIDGYQLDDTFLNPQDGYGIVFNSITNKYTLQPGGPGGFTPGGDLGGSGTNQTVLSADNDKISFAGGDITFDQSVSSPEITVGGTGGNLLVIRGQTATGSEQGGSVAFVGGDSTGGKAGSVVINSGNQTGSGQTGDITIQTNTGNIQLLGVSNTTGLTVATSGVFAYSSSGLPVSLGDGSNDALRVDTSDLSVLLPQLGGAGDGYLSIDNTGKIGLSQGGALGVAWADDLAGSNNGMQWVAAISGPGGTGGTLPIHTNTLTWANNIGTTRNINTASLSPTSTGDGYAGADLHITSQNGQTTTQGGHNGGPSGSVYIYSGVGGTGGTAGGNDGRPGNVSIGDGINNNINIDPSDEDITIFSTRTINLSINTNSMIEVVQSGVVFDGSIQNRQITVGSGTYTVDSDFPNDDCIILVNNAGAVSITMPIPTAGRILTIKDSSGAAASNNILILPHGSERLDGAINYLISTNYGGVSFTSDGTNWFITAKV